MPAYFGMEHDDSSSNDTTAEWVVAGENFGEPAGAGRLFSSEGSIVQDTWYTVKSVWDFQTGMKNLQVKARDAGGPFATVFSNVPIGFLNPNQNLAALNAVGLRLNRGTRLDNLRVEFTPGGLPGDYNGDLTVNAADYAVWRDTLNSETDFRADGDHNGHVDQADFDFWRARFGDSRLPQNLSAYAIAPAGIEGGPNRSDVMFSVRSFFSSPSNYASVANSFHATRNDWTYSAHIAAGVNSLAALGITSGGAMHTSVHDLSSTSPGIMRHWDGVTPLSHWGDDRYSGDVNAPEYRASALDIIKGYIDAGNVRVQWDDPRFNTEFILTKGGGFAPASVAKYRDWLGTHTSAAQRTAAGLPVDLTGFDYRLYVQARSGVVSTPAMELWMDFHYDSSVEFLNWLKQEVDAYAGFDVPFSDNNLGYWDVAPGINTERQEYIDLYRWFDYGIAELYSPDQNPQFIFNSVHRAEELGKRQAFTLVSTNVQLNRKVMAQTYAVGGWMVMPWDVYVPNAPRFFGNPNDYSDITTLVRQHADLFDGYESAAYVGSGLYDEKTALFEPLRIGGGSGQVFAFARAKPGDASGPIVVHLVDWDGTPDPFTLQLRNEMFGWTANEAMTAQLLRPGLSQMVITGTLMLDGYTAFNLPALSPYGLLVIYSQFAASAWTSTQAVPEPSATAMFLISLICIMMRFRRPSQNLRGTSTACNYGSQH